MNKKIKIFLLAVLISLLPISLTSGESGIVDSMDFQGDGVNLTLEEAIEVMLEDNPAIEKAQLEVEQSKVTYDDIMKDVRTTKQFLKGKREDSWQYIQGITIPELTADFTLSNAERNLEATIEGQKADIESSYYGLLQVEKLAEINRENLEISKDLYEKTKKKFELGLVAKQEVLNSELSYINAENQYNEALNTVKLAKMALNTKLGYDVMTELILEDELTYREFEVPSIAEAVEKALNSRLEIKAAEFQYELQNLNFLVISKQYPDITFKYREQKVELEKALNDLETARKNIEMEVRSNYLDVLQKQKEILAGEKAVELAKEALRLSQLSYDVGMSVLTDVQKAQKTLQEAQLGLSKAILDYNLAVLKFEDSIGVGRVSSIPASSY